MKYTLVERPNRELVACDTIRVLGSTGNMHFREGMPLGALPLNFRIPKEVYDAHTSDNCILSKIMAQQVQAVSGINAYNEKEEIMGLYEDEGIRPPVSARSVFADLKTVFDLDIAEEQTPEDFFRDLHYAAEGIRQHEALHRVTDAFVPWAVTEVAEFLVEDELAKKRSDKVTTIIGDKTDE